MFRAPALCVVLAGVVIAFAIPHPVMAADMTVQQFLNLGAHVPRNRVAAMLRPETRRLIGEVTDAVSTVKAEQAQAVSSGRRPAHCIPPSGTGITPESLVVRFESLPQAQRSLTVTQAVRSWMVERYPCPN
ncbi:hypothetical protein D3C72_1212860 [compost metagenome]